MITTVLATDADSPSLATEPSRARARSRWRNVAAPLLCVLAFLAMWEGVSRGNLLPSMWFPAATTTLVALYHQLGTNACWYAVGQTLAATALGLALALVIAVPLGFMLGMNRMAYDVSRGLLDFLRPIPGLALLPLLALVIGVGLQMKVYLVIFGTLWPLLYQVIYGVQDVDPLMLDMARVYRLGRVRQILQIVLPSATPYLATGLRLGAIAALNVAIATELVVGTHGIGQLISLAQSNEQPAVMYAYVVLAGLIGMIISVAARQLEGRVLHWHASQRQGAPR